MVFLRCLGPVQLGFILRNLAKIFSRKLAYDAFMQIATVQRNPSTQKFDAIRLHRSKVGKTTASGP
jgi:hypothetical protein